MPKGEILPTAPHRQDSRFTTKGKSWLPHLAFAANCVCHPCLLQTLFEDLECKPCLMQPYSTCDLILPTCCIKSPLCRLLVWLWKQQGPARSNRSTGFFWWATLGMCNAIYVGHVATVRLRSHHSYCEGCTVSVLRQLQSKFGLQKRYYGPFL